MHSKQTEFYGILELPIGFTIFFLLSNLLYACNVLVSKDPETCKFKILKHFNRELQFRAIFILAHQRTECNERDIEI